MPLDEKPLSAAHEDYLKAIYQLQTKGVRVNNSALASYLNVTPASATNMVKRLAELDLVVYTPYQEMSLTISGERVALEVLRHHRLLELYLHTKLNLPWERVHAEAERLEHVMSDTLEDAISAALDDPTIDPHGDPIPTKDGHVEPVSGIPLPQAIPDTEYRIVRVLLQDVDRLTYLGSLGLVPGALIRMRQRAPFEGPVTVELDDGDRHAIAHEMAQVLLVTPHA